MLFLITARSADITSPSDWFVENNQERYGGGGGLGCLEGRRGYRCTQFSCTLDLAPNSRPTTYFFIFFIKFSSILINNYKNIEKICENSSQKRHISLYVTYMFVPLREKYIFQLKVFVLRFQKFYPFEPLGYRAIKLSCIYCYAFKLFFYLNNGLFEFRVKATKNHIQFLL